MKLPTTHTSHKSPKAYKPYYLLSLLLFLLASCDKTPANGALDGHWQLTSIETPEANTQTKDNLTFLSIQLEIAQFEDHTSNTRLYSHFTHQGDSLLFFDLSHPSAHSVDDNTTQWVTAEELDKGLMNPWGIHTLHTRFHIQTLTSSSLVLEKADTLLRFRKF